MHEIRSFGSSTCLVYFACHMKLTLHIIDCYIHSFLYFRWWSGRSVKFSGAFIGEVTINCLSNTVNNKFFSYKHENIETYCEGARDTAATGELLIGKLRQLPLLELRVKPVRDAMEHDILAPVH